jgi:hypothetical protein
MLPWIGRRAAQRLVPVASIIEEATAQKVATRSSRRSADFELIALMIDLAPFTKKAIAMVLLNAIRNGCHLRAASYLALVAGFILAAHPAAHAQFKIEEILDKGPLRLSAGIDLQLSRFGSEVAASATAFAVLRDAQDVITAMLPGINKRLACARGKDIGFAVTEISPTQMIAGRDQQFAFRTIVQVNGCGWTPVAGQITLVLPVNIRTKVNSVYLQTGTPASESNLTALGFHVSDSVVRKKIAKFTPVIDDMVKKLNAAINTQMSYPSLRAAVKNYRLQISQASLTFDRGDLRVAVQMTGQASTQTVNSWFNN